MSMEVHDILQQNTTMMDIFYDFPQGRRRTDSKGQCPMHMSMLSSSTFIEDYNAGMEYDISRTTDVEEGDDDLASSNVESTQCTATPLTGNPNSGQSDVAFGTTNADWRDHAEGEKYMHLRRHFSGRDFSPPAGVFTPALAMVTNGYVDAPQYTYPFEFHHIDKDLITHEVTGTVSLMFQHENWNTVSNGGFQPPTQLKFAGTETCKDAQGAQVKSLAYDLHITMSNFWAGAPPARLFATATRGMVCATPDVPVTTPLELPRLPNRFTTIVEANIMQNKYTVVVEEAVDHVLKKTKFHTRHPDGNSELSLSLHSQDVKLSFKAYSSEDDHECDASKISTSTDFRDQDHEKNSAEMKSTSGLFNFGDEFAANTSYVGQFTVRGIRTNRWDRKVVMGPWPAPDGKGGMNEFGFEFMLSYFFTAEEWAHPSAGTAVVSYTMVQR
jgi:hypothetical protein